MKEEVRILVVDDEKSMRDALYDWLIEDGYEVETAESGAKAVEKVREKEWTALLVDLKMPGMDGIQTMKEIKKIREDSNVIIITAYATVDTAVQAMKEGAIDYVVKPVNPQEISLIISKIVEHDKLLKENIFLRKELSKSYQFEDIIGKSNKMQEIFNLISTVADSKSTILIQGESGTGKELVARAIHQNSPRKEQPFVSISCGALPEALLESELFGHEKGAFTDAKFLKKGKIELAHGGTLFLDEVGDISLKAQVDLLRVIQQKEFTRVGGTDLIKVDVRFVAATNKDLLKAITQGIFREDLYYRLNTITINMPPLRERKEDIPLLISRFLRKFNIENKKMVERVSEEALRILMNYDWPGNVRELENCIERAVVVCKDNLIKPEDLPTCVRVSEMAATPLEQKMTLGEMEKQHITNVLCAHNWNIQKSAQALGINKVTLYRKIEKYNIKKG